jgi:putative colanic acid biosysnthesis UDP-glucose lipid carrier transferase
MTQRHGHLPRALLVAADTAAAIAACIVAYVLRIGFEIVPVTGRTDVLPARYLEALPIAATVMVLAAALAGLHARGYFARPAGIADSLRAAGLALALLSTAALLYWRNFQYSRLTIVIAAASFAPLLFLARALAARAIALLAGSPRYRSSALVVGGGAPAAALSRAIAGESWMALDVVAVLPVGDPPAAWPRARRIGDVAEARAFLDGGGAREVFVALAAADARHLPALLSELAQTPADVRVVPDLGDAMLLNPSATVVAGLPVVSVRERPLYGLRALAKRSTDVLLAAALLVALSPLFALVALLVLLGAGTPILYRQERMGLDGRPFAMLKFRTMRPDAEAATGAVFTSRGDPRVTAVGRVLRRLSLDELPQLWNVLRGDMSLVGPRPERRPFIEQFRARLPGYMLRQTVKSGMTGWAQVHGLRGESSLEDRLRYDLEYIDRWSFLFDLEILGRTAVQVMVGRNAY